MKALTWLWRKLTSTRSALVLMLIVGVLCILGLALPQAPGLRFGSAEYFDWVDGLGPWAQILGLLGFLDVFQSPWLIVAGALLGLNCLACMIKRLLKTRGRLGPYVLHLGLLVLLSGIAVASLAGFQDPFFVVAEGGQRAVGQDTGLELRLASVHTEQRPDGSFREFRSQVEVLRDGRAPLEGAVSVNHPLAVGDVRFFQAGLGPAPVLLVKDTGGSALFEGTVPLTGLLTTEGVSRPSGAFRLETLSLDVHVVGPAMDGSDSSLATDEIGLQFVQPGSSTSMGWLRLRLGETVSISDLDFTYADSRSFSVFRVTRDPGRFVVWSGFALFILGLVLCLFRRRRPGPTAAPAAQESRPAPGPAAGAGHV
jgi:cytochrome c biogenesis protein ResB